MDSSNFYLFWLPVLAILVAGAGVFCKAVIGVPYQSPGPRINFRDPVAFGLVLLAALLLGLAVLPGTGWGFLDDDYFLYRMFATGRPYPPPIWPEYGRFFPLGHQDWTFFYWWTHDNRIYLLTSLSQYAIFGAGLVVLLKQLQAFSRFGLIFTMTLASVLVSFGNVIIPERVVLTILPWMLYFILRWDRTLNLRYLFLTLICAHAFLYLKEPNFVFLATIAGLRLLPQCYRAYLAIAQRRRHELLNVVRASSLDLALLVSCAVFVVLFVLSVPLGVLSSEEFYRGQAAGLHNIIPVMKQWRERDPVMVVLLIIGSARLLRNVFILRRFDFFDQLIVASCLYVVALIYGAQVGKYYGALPATATAVALTGALVLEQKGKVLKWGPPELAILCVLGVVANLLFATPTMVFRQDWITRNHQAVAELEKLLPDEEGEREVYVKGDYYDASLLVSYADAVRRLDATFQLQDDMPPDPCRTSNRNCMEQSPAPKAGQLVLDIKQESDGRFAEISRDGVVLWMYDSEYLHDLLDATPERMHSHIRLHYHLW